MPLDEGVCVCKRVSVSMRKREREGEDKMERQFKTHGSEKRDESLEMIGVHRLLIFIVLLSVFSEEC